MRIQRFAAFSALWIGLAASTASAVPPPWGRDARTAFDAARRDGKPLLVDLFADWCGWCKVMEARVFPTPEFARLARDFVLLRVDVEDGGEGGELAARYGAESLPTLLVLEPSGALVGAVQGFAEAPQLVQEVSNARAVHERVVAGYEKALASAEPDRLRVAAIDFYRRQDGPRAAALFAKLLAVEVQEGDDLAWTRFFLAESLRRARDFAAARREVAAAELAAAGSRDGELGERIALLPFWIARDEARCEDASGALTEFARRHPASLFLSAARNAFERLRAEGERCS